MRYRKWSRTEKILYMRMRKHTHEELHTNEARAEKSWDTRIGLICMKSRADIQEAAQAGPRIVNAQGGGAVAGM